MWINNIIQSTLQNQKWKHKLKRNNVVTSTSMEQHNQKKNAQGKEHHHHTTNNGEESTTTLPEARTHKAQSRLQKQESRAEGRRTEVVEGRRRLTGAEEICIAGCTNFKKKLLRVFRYFPLKCWEH